METLSVFVENYPLLSGLAVFLLGLSIGSFLNVCIVRLPEGKESVIGGRSHCPQCQKTIAWYDNIPLLSFMLLHGKCRHCSAPISIQYPIVEMISGITALILFMLWGFTIQFLFYGYLIFTLIAVTAIDAKHQIIPDELTFLGMLFGLVMSYCFPTLQGELDKRLALANSSLGMLAGVGLIYGVAILGYVLFRKESMGGGDLKLLAMMGCFVGLEKVILTFFIAPLVAAPIGVTLKLTRKAEIIPYGPYLSIACVVALLWGESVMNWLFRI